MGSTTFDYNQSFHYYDYMYNDTMPMTDEEKRLKADFIQVIHERTVFRYIYHVFAGCIVVLNGLAVVAILLSRKQRRHFRNWLILHILCVHILFGGIALPFNAQTLDQTAAGLGSVALCKLFMFVSDLFEYMSTLTIGMFGVFQCLNMISSRLLKSVSNVLLLSIMIILPWFIVAMMTAVLRLTMSEEQFGQCYIVSDKTAQSLWFILAFVMPMTLVFASLVTILSIGCSCRNVQNKEHSPPNKTNLVFVIICLASCLILRTPFNVIVFNPILLQCKTKFYPVLYYRLIHGPDIVKDFSMILIPFVFIIQLDIRKRCKRFRSRVLCKSVDCTTNARKQQSVEMVSMSNNETAIV